MGIRFDKLGRPIRTLLTYNPMSDAHKAEIIDKLTRLSVTSEDAANGLLEILYPERADSIIAIGEHGKKAILILPVAVALDSSLPYGNGEDWDEIYDSL